MQDNSQLKLLATNLGQLEARIRKIEGDITTIVDKINKWVQSIDGIDQVAFLSMYTLVNGELGKITKENVKATHDQISKGFKLLDEYRDEVMKEVENVNKKDKKNN